ncbi:hypothetical protein DSM100238_1692 [Bifidobacterium apri]|uniref:Uncharacterized protein n=1 Tax=Bifidobacterium apri TaxID=1769423 RepID=A0A6A2WC53_9BIFI|nr:hypothetical protein DSM100238_1692 [Bifidobacterium apri]
MSRHAQRGSRARDVGIRPATPLVAYAATYATSRMRSGQGGRGTYLARPVCHGIRSPMRYRAVVVTLRGIGNVAYVSACGIRKMALTWGAPVGMSAVAHATTCATASVRSLSPARSARFDMARESAVVRASGRLHRRLLPPCQRSRASCGSRGSGQRSPASRRRCESLRQSHHSPVGHRHLGELFGLSFPMRSPGTGPRA